MLHNRAEQIRAESSRLMEEGTQLMHGFYGFEGLTKEIERLEKEQEKLAKKGEEIAKRIYAEERSAERLGEWAFALR